MASPMRTILRAGVVIFSLHLLLKALNGQKEKKALMNQIDMVYNKGNPIDLSLVSGEYEQRIRSEIEDEIEQQADELLIRDLLQSGIENGNGANSGNNLLNSAPNGSPFIGDSDLFANSGNGIYSSSNCNNPRKVSQGFQNAALKQNDLARLEMTKHAESDFTLNDVVQMQNMPKKSAVNPSNDCPTDYSPTKFGSNSITPFSRSIGIHGYGPGSEMYNKNVLGDNQFKEQPGVPNFDPSKNNIGSMFEPSQGLAPFKSDQKQYQIDSKKYQVGPHGNKAGSKNSCNSGGVDGAVSMGYNSFDTGALGFGSALV